MWHRPNAELSWSYYLGPDADDVSPYASPAIASDLSGLPPAYVTTMEFDPLRDEGIIYALRMMQAGVSVELHSYPGTFHGSAMIPTAAVSERARVESMIALRRGLNVPRRRASGPESRTRLRCSADRADRAAVGCGHRPVDPSTIYATVYEPSAGSGARAEVAGPRSRRLQERT